MIDHSGDFPPGLSQPARRALAGAGYTRLEQLRNVSEADLLKLHGLGPSAMRQLREALTGTEQPSEPRSFIGQPVIDERPQRPSLGIRTVTPFRGMFAVVDQLLKELRQWVKQQGITDAGPYFLRYHVIDMDGKMDIEVGCMVPETLPGDERVRPGVLPAGRYASLRYSRYALRANRALIEWGRTYGVLWDRWDDPAGDAFRCRTEAYLTDPSVEPRKTAWEIELAIKIADGSDLPPPV